VLKNRRFVSDMNTDTAGMPFYSEAGAFAIGGPAARTFITGPVIIHHKLASDSLSIPFMVITPAAQALMPIFAANTFENPVVQELGRESKP